jgi:hypothetical protein
MATLKNAPKGAVALAAEVLVNAQAKAQPADDIWVPGTEGFNVGKYQLANDSEILQATGLAMKANDAAVSMWSILADLLHGRGIKASMLSGKDEVAETRAEVEDLVTVCRYGNYVAAETAEGIKISAVADIRASHDRKSIHWKMMSEERRQITAARNSTIRTYMARLIEQLKALESGNTKKTKVVLGLEEKYLELLGPVLLFLQGIDQTKQDPKFDWTEEFGVISAAVNRAKKAKALATRVTLTQ